jgi:Fur family transcriptional regulator, iron response regulator
MSTFRQIDSDADAAALLRRHGIHPTSQRVVIARVMFSRAHHLSADDVFQAVNAHGHDVSKATVYNTLGLLAAKGLIREVVADPKCIFYDSNTAPHHHFYEESKGQLIDIDSQTIQVTGIPPLPEGTHLQGVDVVIRLRKK